MLAPSGAFIFPLVDVRPLCGWAYRRASRVFTNTCKESTDIFEEEERLLVPAPINGVELYRTSIMRRGLSKGTFWYLPSLDSPKGLYNLFHQHMQPRYAQDYRKGSDIQKLHTNTGLLMRTKSYPQR